MGMDTAEQFLKELLIVQFDKLEVYYGAFGIKQLTSTNFHQVETISISNVDFDALPPPELFKIFPTLSELKLPNNRLLEELKKTIDGIQYRKRLRLKYFQRSSFRLKNFKKSFEQLEKELTIEFPEIPNAPSLNRLLKKLKMI